MDSPAQPLTGEAVELLQPLIRFDTVNPPGNERAAQEHLAGVLGGRRASRASCSAARPSARTSSRASTATRRGRCCACSRTSTPCSRRRRSGRHDPWSGDLADGFVWGRGALDMKSQTAAEVVAACSLARAGWRPARGSLLVVVLVDEETGGAEGARWLTATHPEKVRCDYLLNEGGGGLRRVRRPPAVLPRLRREGRLPLRRAHRRRRRPRRRCRGWATTRC